MDIFYFYFYFSNQNQKSLISEKDQYINNMNKWDKLYFVKTNINV